MQLHFDLDTSHSSQSRQFCHVCDLPIEERPLCHLHQHGTAALSTRELLALVLGSAEAPGLADLLLTSYGSLHKLAQANKEQLKRTWDIVVKWPDLR